MKNELMKTKLQEHIKYLRNTADVTEWGIMYMPPCMVKYQFEGRIAAWREEAIRLENLIAESEKSEIKIEEVPPVGWRWLKDGEEVKEGDMYLQAGRWIPAVGICHHHFRIEVDCPFIRRDESIDVPEGYRWVDHGDAINFTDYHYLPTSGGWTQVDPERGGETYQIGVGLPLIRVKIPRGWRALELDEVIDINDWWWNVSQREWVPEKALPVCVGESLEADDSLYIRRIDQDADPNKVGA